MDKKEPLHLGYRGRYQGENPNMVSAAQTPFCNQWSQKAGVCSVKPVFPVYIVQNQAGFGSILSIESIRSRLFAPKLHPNKEGGSTQQ